MSKEIFVKYMQDYPFESLHEVMRHAFYAAYSWSLSPKLSKKAEEASELMCMAIEVMGNKRLTPSARRLAFLSAAKHAVRIMGKISQIENEEEYNRKVKVNDD